MDSSYWSVTLELPDAEATARLALALKPHLSAGDTLLLSGPIGAGKSHFARALIGGFLADHDALEDIPSPTFTLVQTYFAGDLEIWHADLYRLSGVDEVFELGLIDAFDAAICVVEWPEKLGTEAPDNALSLEFQLTKAEETRRLILSARAEKWCWVGPVLAEFLRSPEVANG
ncbi:MAG: tRNA (adenosine(37)-N6)-threonylcarbamoyltransferase complex ATPase subunit type 1 TsaE [Alphaproteobacteria bacterium]|nr:tRNA (adenosine(37)-N6)-threonylcarbamoyltransferase complex ATPase subunit type 1 TsaE [Alphaproteobacteria bacterium]